MPSGEQRGRRKFQAVQWTSVGKGRRESCRGRNHRGYAPKKVLGQVWLPFFSLSFEMESGDDAHAEPRTKRIKHSNAGYFCSVPHCSNRSRTEGRHFHRFPSQVDHCKAPLQAIRRETGENFAGKTRVCSDHFRDQDYRGEGRFRGASRRMVRLRKNAAPSIFAWKKLTKASLAREAQTGQVRKKISDSTESPVEVVTITPADSPAPLGSW